MRCFIIKKWQLGLIALLFLFALTGILLRFTYPKEYKYLSIKPQVSFASFEEKDLYNFVIKNLTSKNGGIFTNTLKKKASGDLPAGDEILSESAGLIMQYALEADSQTLFEKQFLYLKEVYTVKDNIVVWKVDENNNHMSTVSSLIDDLRIAGALLTANEKWGCVKYKREAFKIAKSIRKHSIKNAVPVDYYDFKAKISSDFLSTRYIDLYTMKKLFESDNEWADIYIKSEKILINSSIGDEDIFFYEKINVLTGEYEKLEKVNMANQLTTVENMLKAGIKPGKTLEWLKESFEWYGFIVNDYDASSKRPVSKNESPGVYALCCRIFMLAGDSETAEKFYRRMNIFKVSDVNSHFFGGYAFLDTGESFSYDNLQALLTLRYRSNLN